MAKEAQLMIAKYKRVQVPPDMFSPGAELITQVFNLYNSANIQHSSLGGTCQGLFQ